MSGGLERRYRRVLRLLPGYYRQQWEEDMVTAFLESSLTGDPEDDEFTTEYGRPSWAQACSSPGPSTSSAGSPRRPHARAGCLAHRATARIRT